MLPKTDVSEALCHRLEASDWVAILVLIEV